MFPRHILIDGYFIFNLWDLDAVINGLTQDSAYQSTSI